MAKTCLVVKAKRTPKFAVQGYYRCYVCGRPRGLIKKFQLCRICFRELAVRGMLPGVKKSSW